MKVETRSFLLTVLALGVGFIAGQLYQQRTDEHRLIMAEWKKVNAINQLVDIKLSQGIADAKMPNRKEAKR
jgi:hypothetical protein